MQPNTRKTLSACLLALAPFAPAIAGETEELFNPMPMAALHSGQDPTLLAIHEAPAYHMINRVAADASVLREDTKAVRLSLAPGLQSPVTRTDAQTMPDGSIVWHGQWSAPSALVVSDHQRAWHESANEVTLVNHNGRITGSVHANGQLYSIRPLASGGHAIIEVTERDLPAELTPLETPDSFAKGGRPPSPGSDVANGIDARVMIVFTGNAAKSLADPVAFAHLAVAETNAGYARSGIAHRLQMVDNVYVAEEYRDTGNLKIDFVRFKNPNDGFMDAVHGVRDSEQADLVTLIGSMGDSCGVGYPKAHASDAFSVVTTVCATGHYGYGHVLGYNYGAGPEPGAGRDAYPYGHGFQNLQARLRTVMAHDCTDGCNRVNIWSGPDNRWNGYVMGNDHESDNVRVLNERAATVASFR
jgi:peptidyl-Asp metalloendopeptidase